MKTAKPFTKEQRVKIYRKALSLFKEDLQHRKETGNDECVGMCNSIYHAMKKLEYGFENGEYRSLRPMPVHCDAAMLKKFWPEFAKHKPTHGWKADTRFWFTRYIDRGGAEKRIKVLTELGEYKKKK